MGRARPTSAPVHDAASEVAGKARAAFLGNPALINETKALLLRNRSELNALTIRELERSCSTPPRVR